MGAKSLRRWAPVVVLALALPLTMTPRAQDAQQPIRVQVALVNVFAGVRDKQGRAVSGLGKDDFRVYEEGREQKLDFFAQEASLPLTLGLMIDTSGSQRYVLGAEQQAASRFLERELHPRDRAAVMTFDEDVQRLSGLTGDKEQLNRAIRSAQISVTAGGPGKKATTRGTALYDAIHQVCREQMAAEPGRKALVILSDADDQDSRVKIQDALDAAQRSDTALHFILISDRTGFGFNKGGERAARKLAEATGGRVMVIPNVYAPGEALEKLQGAFDELAEEMRSQYTLGYYPANAIRDGSYRRIRVETLRRDLKVLARKGYFAAKELGTGSR